MHYEIKKSITRESILFLVFLIGILFIALAQNYKAMAAVEPPVKGFFAGKLFVAIPEGTNPFLEDKKHSYMEKSLLLYKAGWVLLCLYLFYAAVRLIVWTTRIIKNKHHNTHLTEGGFSMNVWIKQNWFKGGILLTFVIMGLSVSYYFVLFLPNNQKHSIDLTSKSAAEILELENKCSAAASGFFKENGFDPKNCGFQNHYNSKLNKCFINIKSAKIGEDGHLTFHRQLYDVYSRKKYGEYSWKSEEGKNFWEIKPSTCFALDESCHAIEDYEIFVKAYMEE
jgi:hypothetical protein